MATVPGPHRCRLRRCLLVLALALADLQASRTWARTAGRSLVAAAEAAAGPVQLEQRERFIVVLRPGAVPDKLKVAEAAHKILSETAATAPTAGAASTAPTPDAAGPSPGASALDASFVGTVGGEGAHLAQPRGAVRARSRGVLAFVVEASSRGARLLRRHPAVAAAVPDLQVTIPRAPQTAAAPDEAWACWPSLELSGGIPAQPARPFPWKGCAVARNRLLYLAQRCGADLSGIQYTALVAVSGAGGRLAQFQGQPCVLVPDATKPAAWTSQRFGLGCRGAPTLMVPNSMPTEVCGASPIVPCAPVGADGVATAPMTLSAPVACGAENATALTYTGTVCGSDGTKPLVQWARGTTPGGCELTQASGPAGDVKWAADYFGSCGVPPAAANEGVFSACHAPPPPWAAVPRRPLADGESVPAGVGSIGVARALGGVRTVPDGWAWDELPGDRRVVVGVIDSGIDSTHPDLRDCYVGGLTFIRANVTRDPRDADPGADPFGHGTGVAGVVAAANNGRGIVGVSPGVRTLSLKVVGSFGSGTLSSVLSAVKWVASAGAALGVRVVNISFVMGVDTGSAYYADVLEVVCALMQEAWDAGVVVVAAAGNDGRSLLGYLPAACPTVVAVTALGSPPSATAAPYSNYLPTADPFASRARVVAAPGYADPTTAPLSVNNGYVSTGGTSLSAPHVAGIFANCIMAGACTGTPTDMLETIHAAAARRAADASLPPYGVDGDAGSADKGKYYGWLVWNEY